MYAIRSYYAVCGFTQAGNMGMPRDQHITRLQSEAIRIVQMAVSQEATMPGQQQLVMRRHGRKVEQHLIDFAVAITAHGDDALAQLIQALCDLRRRITTGHRIAGAMVEQISQQQIVIRLPDRQPLQNLLETVQTTVNIGNDG